MSTTEERGSGGVTDVDLKFEAVAIPVADAGRPKEFYGRLGWRLDAGMPPPIRPMDAQAAGLHG